MSGLRTATPYSLMSLEEIAVGGAYAEQPQFPRRSLHPLHRRPDEVLGEVLLGILRRGRLAIAFSGGVDSSGLLCLAVEVARRNGLDDPIAVTARFPAVPATDEREWQELVIAHLGLADWVTVDFTDECDVIGPEAQRALRRYGVRWPPLAYAEQPLMRACGGTIYALGNGGDELTFPTRAGVPQLVARGTVRRDGKALRALFKVAVPSLDWIPGRSLRVLPRWVLPDARERLTPLVRGHDHRRVFRWRRALAHRTNAPWARRGHATLVHSGLDAGVEVVQPLTDPAVIGAMLVAGGRWGFPDRPTAARALFGEALPEAVRRRRDKVDFTHAYFAGPSREFIASWDGTGVPLDLVDPEVLAEVWRSPQPGYSSIPLLQHAWLAANNA